MSSHLSVSTQGSILIVDDNPTNLRLLSKLLMQEGYEVRKALDGSMALKSVQTLLPDLILLDIMMPNIDGYHVCKQLSSHPQTAEVPVIILSALSASFDKVKAFRSGAKDYITKPFQFEEVLARVQHQLALKQARQALRLLNAQLENRVHERTRQLANAHARLLEMAHQDQLTGLPNRVAFVDDLTAALERTRTDEDYQFAILFLDCDRFKMINDSLGHSKGDQLLTEVAHRLRVVQQHFHWVETVARFGGDEFALLLSSLSGSDDVIEVAHAISREFSKSFSIDGHDIFINASMGLVWGNQDYENSEYMLRDADTAMYWTKSSGKGQYRWFEYSMHHQAVNLFQLESDLRMAVERHEFQVYYQPIVELSNRTLVGFEALVRWWHPTKGFISPDRFIPFSEETGLIIEIGDQVLQQACEDLAHWQRSGLVGPDFTLSVNLSCKQLLQADIVRRVQRIVETTGILPGTLRLELTESAIINNPVFVDDVLRTFRERNIQLSIDDFGTGYSSLSYLHKLPVNCLKVDRSFVQVIQSSDDSLGIVPLIINIAHTMGLQVIAEGIETEVQCQQLQALNCDCGQGFLFHEPFPVEEALILLKSLESRMVQAF